MSLHVVGLAQTPLQAWRNGGGVTQELLAWPSADDWVCRVSVARIERNGPFSAFPGVQRWFAVLQGRGVRLHLPLAVQTINPASPPLCFDGRLTPPCELLQGPTEDLNLMLRSDAGRGAMALAEPDVAWASDATWRAVYCTDAADLVREGLGFTALAAGSLAWSDNAAGQVWRLQAVGPSTRALWMHFHDRPAA